MKKTASRLLALALTASLVLSGCSSSGGTQEQTRNRKRNRQQH